MFVSVSYPDGGGHNCPFEMDRIERSFILCIKRVRLLLTDRELAKIPHSAPVQFFSQNNNSTLSA